jgi:hypothetical protein
VLGLAGVGLALGAALRGRQRRRPPGAAPRGAGA